MKRDPKSPPNKCLLTRQGNIGQDKIKRGKTRQDNTLTKTKGDKFIQGKTRQGTMQYNTQEKTRQKTRQCTRQDETGPAERVKAVKASKECWTKNNARSDQTKDKTRQTA